MESEVLDNNRIWIPLMNNHVHRALLCDRKEKL